MQAKSGILSASLKVKGGKLLKCRLELNNNIIQWIKFTGDFFMHPEEKLEDLELMFKGLRFDLHAIRKVLYDFYAGNVLVVGAGAEDFVKLITGAK